MHTLILLNIVNILARMLKLEFTENFVAKITRQAGQLTPRNMSLAS